MALVAAAAQIVPAIIGWKSKKETLSVKEHVVQLKLDVNGKLNQLLEQTAAASRAEGHREGVESEQLRVKQNRESEGKS